MPKLGVEMQTGILLDWVVAEGDAIEESDVIAEIESDKTTTEVAARESGMLRIAILEEGEEVEPGTAMGIVASPDKEIDDLLSELDQEDVDVEQTSPEPESDEKAATSASKEAVTPKPAEQTEEAPQSIDNVEPTRMTPKARQYASETDVDLTLVQGTGPKGSITQDDVARGESFEAAGSSQQKPTTPEGTSTASTEKTLATPRARKRASERNISLEATDGTGPHGSVRAEDVETAQRSADNERSPPADAVKTSSVDDFGRTVVSEEPLTGMRSTIASRLSSSWEAPHVTLDRRVNIEPTIRAAERMDGIVSITDILIKSVTETLESHSDFNATFEDEVHRVYEDRNIGFAVDIESGLVTPVLKSVEHMTVTEIAHQRGTLTERVQQQRHDATDLQGGTFTISNLGTLGIDSFTPIINPPQVAILGVDCIREDPKRTDRGIEFRQTMGLSLSIDHRVIDGADGARFLETLTDYLESANDWLEGN